MNVLTDNEQNKRIDDHKRVLPFYRASDLELAPEEISIDTFEKYANYRMKCMLFYSLNLFYSVFAS